MASTGKIIPVAEGELRDVLDRARVESWRHLVLIGPNSYIPPRIDDWPVSWQSVEQIFQLKETNDTLVGRLQSLTGLYSLYLSGNAIDDQGAKAIATSLKMLTSLDLPGNRIGPEGTTAIATSIVGLTSLNLSNNKVGAEGAKAIAASQKSLTSLELASNDIGDEGTETAQSKSN